MFVHGLAQDCKVSFPVLEPPSEVNLFSRLTDCHDKLKFIQFFQFLPPSTNDHDCGLDVGRSILVGTNCFLFTITTRCCGTHSSPSALDMELSPLGQRGRNIKLTATISLVYLKENKPSIAMNMIFEVLTAKNDVFFVGEMVFDTM